MCSVAAFFVPQAVYELYNVTEGAAWGPDDPRLSRIVLIGRNLKKDALSELFSATKA